MTSKSAITRKANERRRRRLVALHGEPLPEGWKKMSDDTVGTYFAWKKAKADGWLTVAELAAVLGINEKNPEGGIVNRLRQWLTEANWPIAPHTTWPDAFTLYKPFTYEEIVVHDQFPALFRRLSGDAIGFHLKMVLDDRVRAALILEAVGS